MTSPKLPWMQRLTAAYVLGRWKGVEPVGEQAIEFLREARDSDNEKKRGVAERFLQGIENLGRQGWSNDPQVPDASIRLKVEEQGETGD